MEAGKTERVEKTVGERIYMAFGPDA